VSDPLFLSIPELGAAYRSGTLSPVAVTRQALERIAAQDARLNSFITVLGERSLERAAAAESELRASRDRGPLHGVPIAIKDLVDMAGVPTTFASRAGSPKHPTEDAPVIRHLEQAGAVILGKTNLLEYAYGAVHPDFGQTNNPWDPNRTSGGSSGGSAAAVGAGFCFAALGTDTGGSIRIPAAYCGVVGLKPSFGLVDTAGVQALSWSLDHVGPLARSCRDAALLLEGMTGQSLSLTSTDLKRVRFGVVRHEGAERFLEPEVTARFEEMLEKLRAHGAHIQPVSVAGMEQAAEALIALIEPEASVIHARLIRSEPEKFGPVTRQQIEAGFNIPATAYLQALRTQALLKDRFASLFKQVDALLSPAVPWVAPAEDPALEGDGGAGEMLYSAIYNLTGLPALVLPMGLGAADMPVGLQIASAWQSESMLLALGSAVEALSEPPPSARLRDAAARRA
jgi:aspartyl-tRNA(Asn)/glutamyl-tRNA(Gln) amidotransferase subunit A